MVNEIEAEGLDVGKGGSRGSSLTNVWSGNRKEQALWAPRFQTVLNVRLLHTNKLNLSLNVSNNTSTKMRLLRRDMRS